MAKINRRSFVQSLGVAAALGLSGGAETSIATGEPNSAATNAVKSVAVGESRDPLTITVVPSGKDDTRSLQAAIDRCLKRKQRLALGEGVFHISETLKIDRCLNFCLAGMGAADPNAKNGWAASGRALGTCLRWKGAAGGTMLLIKSSMWPTISGLFFDAAGSAGVGIQMSTVFGWPTSGVRLRDITVSRAMAAGIQFDMPSQPNGDNTDLSDFDSITLNKCAVGIRVCNDQSVGHYWRRINNSFSQVAIEFLQGGDVIIERGWQDGPGPADATFFKTHGGGENAAQIQISGIHLEHGRLFDSRLAGIVVGIRGIQDSRSDTHAPPLCIFGKWAGAVTIMASQLKGPIIATPETSVTLIGCTYVTASVPHPVRKLVQGTKKVHVL